MAKYLEFFKPFTRGRQAESVHDLAPWRSIASPDGTLLLKHNHALMRSYTLRGQDPSAMTTEMQGAMALQANNALKRLGGGWSLHAEAQRQRFINYPQTAWHHPVLQYIDEQYRQVLCGGTGTWETHYYATLTWRPPAAADAQVKRLFLRNVAMPEPTEAKEHIAEGKLDAFAVATETLMAVLGSVLAHKQQLGIDDILTYLHTQVSDTWHPVRWSGIPTDIDMALCDRPYVGEWEPQLGDWHLRTCSIQSYPSQSMVGMLRKLDSLEVPYRYVVRWSGLEKMTQEGILRKTQHRWLHQEETMLQSLSSGMSGRKHRILDHAATRKAEEVDAARQDIGMDMIAYGHFTATVTVWDEDPAIADAKCRQVMRVFDESGFTSTKEEEHATEAWLSTLAGNTHTHVRKTAQHSLTLAHMFPGLTATHAGIPWDTHFDAPPWFHARTDTNSVTRICNHVNDLGHFLVFGATRSGKSTLAAFMVAQWQKYKPYFPGGVGVDWWDLDGSARLLTLLLGGSYNDIAGGTMGFQPLRRLETAQERAWAIEWLLSLCRDASVPITGAVEAHLRGGIEKLATRLPRERTLSTLTEILAYASRQVDLRATAGKTDIHGISHPDLRMHHLVEQFHNVRMALQPFVGTGTYGWLLDADHDDLDEQPIQCFDQRTLLELPRVVGPVARYLFHQLRQKHTTDRPTLSLRDDAAVTWDIIGNEDNTIAEMMTSAKRNVSIGIFTHALSQVFERRLGGLLLVSTAARYYMATPNANEPEVAEMYKRAGLNSAEIQLLATARQQSDAYFKSAQMQRLLHMRFPESLLAVLAKNTQEDHALMDELLRREGREGFPAAWCEKHGIDLPGGMTT